LDAISHMNKYFPSLQDSGSSTSAVDEFEHGEVRSNEVYGLHAPDRYLNAQSHVPASIATGTLVHNFSSATTALNMSGAVHVITYRYRQWAPAVHTLATKFLS